MIGLASVGMIAMGLGAWALQASTEKAVRGVLCRDREDRARNSSWVVMLTGTGAGLFLAAGWIFARSF